MITASQRERLARSAGYASLARSERLAKPASLNKTKIELASSFSFL